MAACWPRRCCSQEREHAPYGGVVPEIAARAHLAASAGPGARGDGAGRARLRDLGGVAASGGPGLIGGLIVGSQFAKGIAIAHGLPFVAVNHLEAHALTARLPGLVEGGAPFPYLLLLVSGGHCQCVAVEGVGRLSCASAARSTTRRARRSTRSAKLLGLGWPGGPALERLAAGGDPQRFAVPAPDAGPAGLRFQFLRPEDRGGAEVARPAGRARCRRRSPPTSPRASSARWPRCWRIAPAHAMAMMRERATAARLLVVAGGVAANAAIRAALDARPRRRRVPHWWRRRCGCAPTTR